MKKYKKIMKDSLGLGMVSLTTGMMASAVTQSGGNASGLETFGKFTPTFATIMGAGHTLNMTKSLIHKKKKKR